MRYLLLLAFDFTILVRRPENIVDPFEKMTRMLLDNLASRVEEARYQGDERRCELLADILADIQRISTDVLRNDKTKRKQ